MTVDEAMNRELAELRKDHEALLAAKEYRMKIGFDLRREFYAELPGITDGGKPCVFVGYATPRDAILAAAEAAKGK